MNTYGKCVLEKTSIPINHNNQRSPNKPNLVKKKEKKVF